VVFTACHFFLFGFFYGIMTTFRDVVRAVNVLESAPSTLSLIRDLQDKDTILIARKLERSRKKSYVFCESWESLPDFVAGVVEKEDTPPIEDVCRMQLSCHPSSHSLGIRSAFLSSLYNCYDVIVEVSKIREMVEKTSHLPVFVQHEVLSKAYGVSTDNDGSSYGEDRLCESISQRLRSPCFEMLVVMSRVLPHFPVDLLKHIVCMACDDKKNHLHVRLHSLETYDALMCRANLQIALASVIKSELTTRGKLHISLVLHEIEKKFKAVRSIENVMKRTDSLRTTGKRSSSTEQDVMTFNTLIICDSRTSRIILQSDTLKERGLIVRRITQNVDMSTALHADIVVASSIAVINLRRHRFKRCIVMSVCPRMRNLLPNAEKIWYCLNLEGKNITHENWKFLMIPESNLMASLTPLEFSKIPDCVVVL